MITLDKIILFYKAKLGEDFDPASNYKDYLIIEKNKNHKKLLLIQLEKSLKDTADGDFARKFKLRELIKKTKNDLKMTSSLSGIST